MRHLHIGLVTNAMYGGGVETFLLRLGQYLIRKGMNVEIVTTMEPGEWAEKMADYGIGSRHIPGYGREIRLQTLFHSWRVGRWLRARGYDVIFLNHARHALASLGMLSDDTFVCPILHNDTEEVYADGCSNPLAWNVAVGVSPKLVNEAHSRVPERPIQLIPHGVEMPEEANWRSRVRHSKPFHLCFVGRLTHRQKGIFLLPEIIQRCTEQRVDVRLTVVGDGPDGPQLREDFKRRGLIGRVRFTGMIPPEQVYAQLLNSHVTVVPSFYEGLGITVLESLACGAVPIVSHLAGVTDYSIDDGINGRLVEVGDVDGFAGAIAKLARQPKLWGHMSVCAHNTACTRFSLVSMGEAYLRLVEAGLAGTYPLPLSRRWQLPIDLRMVGRSILRQTASPTMHCRV